jgi:hypothetical protein
MAIDSRGPLALMLDPGEGKPIGCRPAERVIQRDRRRDIRCPEPHPFEDERDE